MASSNEKKSGKLINELIIIFLLVSIVASGFLIYGIYLYSGVETLIRYIVIGVIILNEIRLIFKTKRYVKGKTKNNKPPKKKLFLFGLIIYSLIYGLLGYFLLNIYGMISGVNKTNVKYTSYLIVMKDNPAESIKDVKDMTIGILKDKNSPDGYIIPQEMIKENNLQDDNEIKEYDDYTSMLVDLYASEIDGLFITSNY